MNISNFLQGTFSVGRAVSFPFQKFTRQAKHPVRPTAEGVYSLNLSIIYSNSKALSCCPHWRECAVWTITCFLFHNSNLILLNKRILECCLQTSFSGLLPWAKRNPEFPCILVTLQYFAHSHHWSMKTGGQFFYPEMCSGAEENPLSHNIGFFTMLEINENNRLTLHFLLLFTPSQSLHTAIWSQRSSEPFTGRELGKTKWGHIQD